MTTKKIIELEHEEARLRDRIKDLEFRIQCGLEQDKCMAERHRAVDKLRHVQDAIRDEKLHNIRGANA